MSLNPLQFHEMTRDEFEAQSGTFFHGNPTGSFNWEQPRAGYGFHVGTRRAAEEAVIARAGVVDEDGTQTSRGMAVYSNGERIPLPLKGRKIKVDHGNGWFSHRYEAHPDTMRGGRITSPMVNTPHNLGAYGLEETGDTLANAKAREITSKGQTMRQGIYYTNRAEDEGSVSAVLPGRQFWKTHEDYLVEAREQGKVIPERAAKGYKQIPGQQVLF